MHCLWSLTSGQMLLYFPCRQRLQTNSGLTSWAQQEKYVHWKTRESPQRQSILCPLKLLRLNHARTVK